MNFKRLLTQAAVAIIAIAGEAAITYIFNRRNEA
jgi:hypothetical protein